MNTDNNTLNDVREISHPDVVKRTNVTSILLTSISILAGILSVVLWSGAAGVILIITGALIYVIKPKTEVYEPTGCKVYRKSYFVASEKTESVIKILEGELNDSVEPLQFLQSGSVRIDTLFNKERNFMAWQIFHFVPHRYEPVTKVNTLSGPPAVQFSRFLERSEKA